MQIAGVKLMRDGTAGFMEPRSYDIHLPVAREDASSAASTAALTVFFCWMC
jgi:hypothetical protein